MVAQIVRLQYPDPIESLTERERQVLRAYVEHGVQKIMAHELGMAQHTLKVHITSILSKLNVATTGQAAVLLDRAENGRQLTWPQIERRSGRDRRSES